MSSDVDYEDHGNHSATHTTLSETSLDTNIYPYYNYYNDYYEETYTDIFYYKGFDFERPVYLYAWIILVILTTLGNILVIHVLNQRNMRSATNVILISIAIADSLTGLVTIPVIIYAFSHYEAGDLALTKKWCEAYMLVRYFVSRCFHTMSVWLTLLLGFQRLVSVSFPFRAQNLFTIQNTVVSIVIISLLAPLLHIYHAFNRKTWSNNGMCEWRPESPCKETCAYLMIVAILMHFLPSVLLVVFTTTMVCKLYNSTKRIRDTHMIANQNNLNRRDLESRRISGIVIAVVIVFLIPEIPYGTFLLITASLTLAKKPLMDLKTNRSIICAYELLVVFSFQANFWIYLIMNNRFRHGLKNTFSPLIRQINACLFKTGIKFELPRVRSDSFSFTARSDYNAHTTHSRLSRANSSNSRNATISEPMSPTESVLNPLSPTESALATSQNMEMKTYHFTFSPDDISHQERQDGAQAMRPGHSDN